MKISHILLPTDFSKSSQAALVEAVGLAAQSKAKVSIIHVLEPVYLGTDAYSPWMLEFEKGRSENAQAQIRALQERIPATSRGEIAVQDGQAWRGIVEWANEHGVDLILLPTHGYSGLKHLWLGSVAERVVQHAKCPVLITRGEPE